MGCFGTKLDGRIRPATFIQTKAGKQQLIQIYNIHQKILGAGTFGKVFLAENKQNPEHKVAIKVMQKSKFNKEEIESIRREVAILQTLDHPNIVKYYETYDDVKYQYLVMELCSGGELFDRVSDKNKNYSEHDSAVILEKLLKAINHCHSMNISHRDIKPENIMYGADGEVKLIDFGLASQTKRRNQSMHTIAGTPYFIAPEVLNGDYGKECDIWSLGVVLYMLISGRYPFEGSGRSELFLKIQKGKFHFNHPQFSKVSDECKDLIRKMICPDRKKRLTANQCLNHQWFKQRQSTSESEIDQEVIERLKAFKGSSKLKKAALNVLVKMLGQKDVEKLREQFQRIDTDNSGFIEFQELETVIKKVYKDMTTKELRSIIKELDHSGNQRINYSEFLAATISIQDILTHDRLGALFKQFDLDNKEEISIQNIQDAMAKLGKRISLEEIEEIMKKHDASGDKLISFEEFKQMMFEMS